VLGVSPELLEGSKRSINVSFIEVHEFFHTQLRIFPTEGCVGPCILRIVRVLPLVNLCISNFDPICIVFFLLNAFWCCRWSNCCWQ
jgi:hypothetical protein